MKLFITFFFIIPITTFAQVVKTYSGPFNNGTASYQYYENDQYDRIFHGSFKYSSSLFDMIGKFNDGERDGIWVFSVKDKNINTLIGTLILNTNISGQYKNGSLTGQWLYETSFRLQDNPSKNQKYLSNAKFLNNHFVDKVSFKLNSPSDISVNGQFDNDGFMTGVWIYKSGTIKDEIRFNKGIAFWRLIVDTTSGTKISFSDNTLFVDSFWKNYNYKNNLSIIGNIPYYLDTLELISDTRVPTSYIPSYNVGDPQQPINSEYNPICIWLNNNISVFNLSLSIPNPLYFYSKGCRTPAGYQLVIKECAFNTKCYELLQNKEIIAQSLHTGDSLFLNNNFHGALEKYLTVKELQNDRAINEKINLTKKEINKLEKLQKEREVAYHKIIDEYNTSSRTATLLYHKLKEGKEIYSKNYLECISILTYNFDEYISRLDSLHWTQENNQIPNNQMIEIETLLIKFTNELDIVNSFTEAVQLAFDTSNKEKLKILGSKSIEPQQIINTLKAN